MRWLALVVALLLLPLVQALTPEEIQLWRDTNEDFDWQQPQGSVVRVGRGAADKDGNLYFAGSVELGTDLNAFVAQITVDGTLGWTKQYGTQEVDAATFITILNETTATGVTEQLFIAGYTWGYLDEGGHALNGFGQYGGRDVVLAKLTLGGVKLWLRQFGTTANDFAYGVSLDGSFNTLLLSGGCETNQVDETVEVDVAKILETRTQAKGFSDYESQIMDPEARASTEHRQYDFAVSLNFGGDILDYAMDGGVTLTPRRQRIREGGLVAEYAVVLNRQPLADVAIQADDVQLLSPSGVKLHQLQFVTPQRVVFTPANWNREQYVRLTALDDALAEGRHYAVVTHSVSSSDPNFNGKETPFLAGRNITVQIDDNDRAGVSLSRTHVFVAEGGGKDSYDAVLTSQPWYPVKLTIVPMQRNQTAVAPQSLGRATADGTAVLTFQPGDWNIPQRVVVSAVDDTESEAEYGGLYSGGTLLHYTESKDIRYHTRRPQCFDVPNCDPLNTAVCLVSGTTAQTSVRVCDLTNKCAFSLDNGACVANVVSSGGKIPVRFGNSPLNPADTDTSATYMSYTSVRDMLQTQPNDINLAVLSGNADAKIVEPPPELRGFVLSFLGLMNLDQVRKMSATPQNALRAICAGLVRLQTMRWAYEEWPAGYVGRVLDAVFAMFPQSYALERHAWNCGMTSVLPMNSINVSIWDNDPGVTLSAAALNVSEGDTTGAAYQVVLNAPPAVNGVAQVVSGTDSSVYCVNKQSNTCGFWGDQFSTLAATIYDQSAWKTQTNSIPPNVSIAIVGNSQVTVSPSLLTFTATNWFVPQSVVVRALDDVVAEFNASYTISHRVQNSVYGYTGATAFWFRGTLDNASRGLFPQWSAASGGSIPYNPLPTVIRSPDRRQINVFVTDNDVAKVNVVRNQPPPTLATKEATDTMLRWVGDYVTALAFHDVSLTTATTQDATIQGVLSNILMFAPNVVTLMKFHLPQLHDGDTTLAFSGATLVLRQTPYKIFNASDSSNGSDTSSQASFSKVYLLRITAVNNAWTPSNISSTKVIPSALSFLQNASIQVNATVERGRSIEVDVSSLLVQVLPTRLSVVSLLIEVLSQGGVTKAFSTTQLCSSLFERKLRPFLSVKYKFPNLLSGLAATQSSTSSGLSASLATNGATYNASITAVATTNSESEPWWEVTLPQLTKLGTIAIFVPAAFVASASGTDTLRIMVIASLVAFTSKPLALKDALVYGCPNTCPRAQRLTVRKGIVLWEMQAGAVAIRIYREGTGALQLSQVQAFESFVSVTPTADGTGIRSRSKAAWSPSAAAIQSWRLLQTVRKSEDENVAVGMVTRQSSTNGSDALSYLAVDGLKNATWDPLFIRDATSSAVVAASTQTTLEANPWWEVDLGSVKPVRSVVLYPYVGSRFGELCAPEAVPGSNGYPAWSGDLYNYSQTDSLLQLSAPFAQNFDVLLSDLPLTKSDSTSSGAQATTSTTLSFSCANYASSITWDNIFSKGRYVTVRKSGQSVLMLNEVEVVRWNPTTMSRYLLLDLFGRGEKALALNSVQVFPPGDVAPISASTIAAAAPILYSIHSASSQLTSSGAGSASALLNVKDITQCYVASAVSFHEWVVLDFGAPVRVGLVDVNANVSQCSSSNVESVYEFSVASYGAALDGIRSGTASAALAADGAAGVCSLTAMGTVISPSSSCKTYVCAEKECQMSLRAQGAAANGVVLSDFVDITVLGKADFLPISRLPLSQNEHRSLLLRDNPAQMWLFDDGRKMFANADLASSSWQGSSRVTGVSDISTNKASVSLKIDDSKESTFFSKAVIAQPAMSSFTVETWVQFSGTFTSSLASSLPLDVLNLYGVNGNGDQVAFGEVGIASDTALFFFKVTNPADGLVCRASLSSDAGVLPIAGMWHHVVAIYDPGSSSVSLSVCVSSKPQSSQCYKGTAACNLAILSLSQKLLVVGAPLAATTTNGFVGQIASAAWYVSALTTTDILDHYHDFLEGVAAAVTGAHNTYSIGLSTKPLQPVTIEMNAESSCYRFNLCNVSAIPSVLTFTTEDWASPKLVRVLATDDQLYEGLHSSTVSHSESSTPMYQVTSQVTTPSVNSDSGGGKLLDTLNQSVDAFLRDLVLYGVLQDDSTRLARQNALLDLQKTWAPQSVQTTVVSANVYASGLPVDPVPTTITDLTVPGIDFSTTTLSVSEDGKGNDYQIVLLSEPTQVVQVTLLIASGCYRSCVTTPQCPSRSVVLGDGTLATSASNMFLSCGVKTESLATSTLLCNITVSPDVLVFSNKNWSMPQTVRVVAVDDYLDEADVHVAVIKAASASLDPIYNQLILPDIVVAIADNDATNMSYSATLVSLSEKGATQSLLKYPKGDYYTLQLTSEPYANVTIAMSNEANKACYRRCGYPFDEASCGLPRQQSVSLVTLRSNSTREIHQIAMSMTKITEVQRIVTYASHVDQIIRLQVAGGFGVEVQAIVFQFNEVFKLKFPSSADVTAASTYGGAFVVLNSTGVSTTPLDLFATAQQVMDAVNGLFPGGVGAVNATRDLQYSQSTLTWSLTFQRLIAADGTFPLLAVGATSAIDGSLTTTRIQAASSPSGAIKLNYGATTFQLSLGATAPTFQSALSSQAGIYTVSVSRAPLVSADYGFEYSITFASVDSYEYLTLNSSASAIPANASVVPITVSITETQSPVRIGGAFVIDYFSPSTATNPTKPNRTVPIFWNDSSDALAAKLVQLQGVGNVTVSRQRLSGEGAMTWTVQFLENNGNLSSMIATSLNLTGQGVTVVANTVRDGESLRGNFTVQMGGWFKKMDPSTSRVYVMNLPLKNTTLLPFNASSSQLQTALFALNITELTDVSRAGVSCDLFDVCTGYIWTITYTNSPGNVPPIAAFADDYMVKAPGIAISATTVANGTYLGGNFSLRLDLLDPSTNVSYTGTTWLLPVNVSAIGMDEALEAISFVRSNREAEYDPETKIWRGIKFDKGVRVYRQGPFLDGGYMWRLEWALEDYMRFADLKITMNVSLITQEIEPLPVPSELDLQGKPRCAAIPTALFQADPTDPLGLRGFCVYAIANETVQERFLCNYTVLNPWIVFTPENWCIPQQVRLTAVDDSLDEYSRENSNVTFSAVTHTTYSDDYFYLALPLPDVTVKVESDDVAKVLVSASALEVSEDGKLVAQYNLQLNSEPLADVKIVVLPWLDGNNTMCYRFGLCNLTLPVTEYVFTARNWNVSQQVLVRATDDDLDEYDTHMTGISHLSYSDDPKYNAIPTIPKINVTVRDNDVSGFVVNKTSAYVKEGNFTDAYSVVLTSEPFAKVTVAITNVGTVGNYAVASPAQLVFTWRNWNISQNVSVAAFDDSTQDPVGSFSTLVHSLNTNDLIYAALRNLAAVTVFITDNDVSGIELSTRALQAVESNTTVLKYGVRLTSEPWKPVTIQPNASNNCYLRVQSGERVCNASVVTGSTSLLFSATNWNVWQNVSIIAVDDWLDEADVHTARISHASLSADPLYAVSDYTASGGDVTLSITDNDVSYINLTVQSAANQLHVAEGSFNDSYTISLNSEPYEYVTVTLRPTIEKITSLSNASLVFNQPQIGTAFGSLTSSSTTVASTDVIRSIQVVFTPLDWNQPRKVTVFAIDDAIPEPATQYSTVLHSVLSADARYNISNSSIGVTSVSVMISDRESIPPPLPLTATFDSTGSKIGVVFDSTVYHAASMDVSTSGVYITRLKTFSCSLVFTLAAAKYYLGAQAICLWLDGKTLRIELGTGATVSAADKLVLNGCSSFNGDVCNATDVLRAQPSSRAYSQASIAVQVPSDIVQPNAVLVVPENTGSCGAWSADASLSSGGGGRPYANQTWFALPSSLIPSTGNSTAVDAFALYLRLNTSIDSTCQKYITDWKSGKSTVTLIPGADLTQISAGNATIAADITTLTTMAQLRALCYLRAVMQNATATTALQLSVNSSLLEPGVPYRVGLRLVNAFAQSTVSIKTVNVQSLPGPAVFIVGDSTQNVSRTGAPIVMQVDSTLSCPSLSGATVAYRWSTTSQNGSAGSNTTEDFSQDNSARDPRVYRLARSVLQAGRAYTFRVEAYLTGLSSNQSSSSFASIVVNVSSSPPQVSIKGGNCALGNRDALALDGSSTVDPDASNDTFTYAWTCQDITNVTDTSPTGTVCFNASTTPLTPLVLPSTAVLKVAPFNLVSSRTLKFTLTASKGSRSGAASSTIWTVAGQLPVVRITASAAKINPSSRLTLVGEVSSDYPYTTRWIQTLGDLVLPNATTSNTSDAFTMPLTSMSNAIRSYALTAGLTYTFRLVATDSAGNVGFGSVSVVVNSPPASGTFTVSPKSGYAMQDSFTLTCSMWSDDVSDYPLSYSFGVLPLSDFLVVQNSTDANSFVDKLQRSVTPLVSSQVTPQAVTTMLPPENMEDSVNITVVAFISDNLGSTVAAYDTIEVKLPEAVKAQPVQFVASLFSSSGQLQSSGDSAQKVRQVLAAAMVLEKAFGTSSTANAKKAARRLGSCPAGYMGTNCDVQVAMVQKVITAILKTLASAASSVEVTSSGLGQQTRVVGSLMRAAPEVLSDADISVVTKLSSSIANSALRLNVPADFLAASGSTLLEVVSGVVTLVNSGASSGVSTRRLASASSDGSTNENETESSTCNGTETSTAQADWANSVTTLQSLAALSSQGLLSNEPPATLSFGDVSTLSAKGIGFTDLPTRALAMNLTSTAVSCLRKNLFLNALTLAKSPHSSCTLGQAQAISSLTLFSVHSQAAFDQAAANSTFAPDAGIDTETLASTSVCVTQATASIRRLASDGEEAGSSKWVPLVALTIPHARELSDIEQRNFSTTCRIWSAEESKWQVDVCFKDESSSTSELTVCYCTQIEEALEVLVTLEERLDFYALHPDLYRNDPPSLVVSIALVVLVGVFVFVAKAGQRLDTRDARQEKLTTIKRLNRAKWSELQARAKASNVFEDFDAYYVAQKKKRLESHPSEAQTALTDVGESSARVSRVHDLSFAVPPTEPLDPTVVLPDEARTLFGSSSLVDRQYARVTFVFRISNVLLTLIGLVLLFAGIEVRFVLGRTPAELVLYLYGGPIGVTLIISGVVLLVGGIAGVLLARREASNAARATYLLLLGIGLIAQLLVVAFAFHSLENFEALPRGAALALKSVWDTLPTSDKTRLQGSYGCCGFLAISEEASCPEEALDAVPPRTCSAVLGEQAAALYSTSYVYLVILFFVEVACVALANLLVRWRRIRLIQLATNAPSAASAILRSLVSVGLLCTLPPLYTLLCCASAVAIFFGVDMVVQWKIMADPVVTALFGVEAGGLVVAAGVLYLLLSLRALHVLGMRDVQALRWVVGLAVVYLLLTIGFYGYLKRLSGDFYVDPSITLAIEAKYLALPQSTTLLELEMAMGCCGFRDNSQGACIESAQEDTTPTCHVRVEQALLSALSLATDRLTVFMVAQAVVMVLSAWLCVKLRRFSHLAAVQSEQAASGNPHPPTRTQQFCVAGLAMLNTGAAAGGILVLCLGLDVLLKLNVLQISYLLRVFDRHLAVYLLVFGGAMEFFAILGGVVAWMGAKGTPQRAYMKARLKWLVVCYSLVCVILFVCAFGVLGVAHKFSYQLTPLQGNPTVDTDSLAISVRLIDMWTSAPPSTKQFVQNSFHCCGYERVELDNGSVTYTLVADEFGWRRLSSTSTYLTYTRDGIASKSRVLIETQAEVSILSNTTRCPVEANDGCANPMKRYISRVSTIVWKACSGLAGFSVLALLCVGGLYHHAHTARSWQPRWRLRILRSALLVALAAGTLAGLVCIFLGVDVAAGWTLFSSSALQMMFAQAFGAVLILYGVLTLLAHIYSARAALQFSVHQLFLQCVARSVLVVALLAGVGLTAHLSHYSTASETSWRAQLIEFLDTKWSDLEPSVQNEIALEFSCCGFNDPALIPGRGVVFDRPALGYPGCSLAISKGCKTPLVKGVESSFAWMFALFLSLALLEAIIGLLGALMLRDVRHYEGEAWFALESRLRYVAGSFRRDFRRHHMLVSVGARFDARLTRTQRAVSVLCAWATCLAVYAAYFATEGCYRTALKTCEQPGVGELLGLGLLYGGIVGYAVQTTTVGLFEHVRHRADDETKEVATARQRKEKVLLFRTTWFRRRPNTQQVSQGIDQSALADGVSTLDTAQTTTEERWFVWLTRFVSALFQTCGVVIFLGGCALATLLGLLKLGYNNSLYGVPLDEDAPALLGLAGGLVVVSLLAALANDLREQQQKRPQHRNVTPIIVTLVIVAITAVLALGAVLLSIFMIHEVVQEDATALTSWSVRTTGFSVVERLETAWRDVITNYLKDSVQRELRCCGFLDSSDAPFLPCPEGDPIEVSYQALSVSGTVVDKTQQEFTTLPGCRDGMLARFHRGADVATYCAIAAAGVLFLLATSALFLARELAISKDSKLKVRVPESTANADEAKQDVRETFETVVGLKIAAPTRGKLRSHMLASSLESVTPTVASELAAAPLKHEQILTASTPTGHDELGNVEDPDEKEVEKADPSSAGSSDVPYPASIVYVVFMICLVWLAIMAYVVAISAMELGLATSWRCVLAWAVGVVLQELVVEPSAILASIVARTLKDWWARTFIARLIRRGRALLRIGPQDARSLAREDLAKSLSLYDRLRYAAAVRIQRRLVTRVTRARYLRQLRAQKQEQHRSLAAQRRETLRKTLGHFSEEEIEAFRLLFVSADAAQLGLISHTAIAQAVYELGVHVPAPKVRELLHAFDPAYADLVDFEHFLYGMHCVRQYHQQLQSQTASPDQVATSGATEKLLSSSDRFGPNADPRAELLVKRQNLLRELHDRRESLAHKLMRKVSGKLPPVLQRGKSGRPSEAVDEASSAEETAATTDEAAQPSGTFVFWQNRKLSPKKRALESALKKSHKEGAKERRGLGGEAPSTARVALGPSALSSTPPNISVQRALKSAASKRALSSRGGTSGAMPLAPPPLPAEGSTPPLPPDEAEEKAAPSDHVVMDLSDESSPSVGAMEEATQETAEDRAAPPEAKPFGAYMLLTKQSPLLQTRGLRSAGDQTAETSRPTTAEKPKPSSALEKALLKKQKTRKPQ